MSTIKNLILLALEEDKDNEIHGTNHLAELLLTENRAWVRSKLRELQRQGVLNIINSGPGRGRKNIIRRNRNSPGYPRKAGQ